ncbi:MAG TPA: hypothetical protein VFE27_00615 [Acidobacteriaceae bacterium]|jgi:hypothetical protein|nr:hypothetical protein [Acidobacteriaceae bacterium]
MALHPRTLRAWLLFDFAFVLHACEEAATGFLPIYNQTAVEMRTRIPWLRIPVFTRREWLGRLGIGIGSMLAISPQVYRGARWTNTWIRVISGIMFTNALLHIAGTIRGRTFASIRFARPMPGFYSSAPLAAASLNLLAAVCAEDRPKENRA